MALPEGEESFTICTTASTDRQMVRSLVITSLSRVRLETVISGYCVHVMLCARHFARHFADAR